MFFIINKTSHNSSANLNERNSDLMTQSLGVALLILVFTACSIVTVSSTASATAASCTTNYAHFAPNDYSQAPDKFVVEMSVLLDSNSVAKTVKIQVVRDWSPLGADRFYAMVMENYFDCAIFYRNVPNFILQFGYAADVEESAAWRTVIMDDPVVQSNSKGTLTFATSGENSRSTHLFFNFKDNSFLDDQGFSPFATVLEGYDTLLEIYNPTPGDSGGISQESYETGGNEWVLANYPDVSLIQTIAVTDDHPVSDTSLALPLSLVSVAVLVTGVVAVAVFVKCRKSKYQTMDSSETLAFQSEDSKTSTIEIEL